MRRQKTRTIFRRLRVGAGSASAVVVACLALWAASDAAVGAAGGPPGGKLDAALRAASTGTVRVIVRTEHGGVSDVADRLRGRGRAVLKTHTIIEAITADVPVEDLSLLESDPMVANVSLDAAVRGSADSGSADSTANPLLATLGLPYGRLTGKGVGVAVIDSGVDPGGDFSIVRSVDFTDRGLFDEYGHGTHLAGLVASRGALSQGAYVGIAPRADLISLKVLDAAGYGATSTVIEAIEFAIVNRKALGIDVINLSLGHPIYERASTDPLVQAVEAATRAGITVVVSAGNVGRSPITGLPGYWGILSPGNAPSAITVGAVNTRQTAARNDDAIAAFSSRGPSWFDALPKPDLVAPGQSLVSDGVAGSTLFTQLPDRQVAGNGGIARFLRLSGTSMSAAVTSGTVALMIEAGRTAGADLSPPMIKTILGFTALPVAGADRLSQGHGALNAAGAVALAAAVAAAAGSSTEVTPVPPLTTIAGETWLWAQSFDWDETVVWGNHDWDDTVVWGNYDWDGTVVWGNTSALTWDDAVWGNAADPP